MRFVPGFQLNILKEEEFSTAIHTLVEEVERCKHSGNFVAFDGVKLYYEYFLCENARANVIIVHGLSEFTRKFYEFAYYLLHQGYNVFVYDQRCHGYSDRLTDEMDLLHVRTFTDYVKDLDQFINEIVVPTEDKPLYIYSHSMGGAVTTQYLEEMPGGKKIEKAVLAAPMFEPVVKNVAFPIAKWSVSFAKIFCGGKKRFVLSKDFNPNAPYRNEYGSSRARFDYNMDLRRNDPHYRSTPMSFGWVTKSLHIGARLVKKRKIKKITTPILLLSAQGDTTVRNGKQRVFSKLCPNCRFVELEKLDHAILGTDYENLSHIMELIISFYGES